MRLRMLYQYPEYRRVPGTVQKVRYQRSEFTEAPISEVQRARREFNNPWITIFLRGDFISLAQNERAGPTSL